MTSILESKAINSALTMFKRAEKEELAKDVERRRNARNGPTAIDIRTSQGRDNLLNHPLFDWNLVKHMIIPMTRELRAADRMDHVKVQVVLSLAKFTPHQELQRYYATYPKHKPKNELDRRIEEGQTLKNIDGLWHYIRANYPQSDSDDE